MAGLASVKSKIENSQDMLTHREFMILVYYMRIYQKSYFKNKDQKSLIESKVLEKMVDEAIARQSFD